MESNREHLKLNADACNYLLNIHWCLTLDLPQLWRSPVVTP